MEIPDIQYTRSGDIAIAYQTFGDGPRNLVLVRMFSNLVFSWSNSDWRELYERFASFARELSGFRGEELDTAGDGFFAIFDGPARAISCARTVVGAVGEFDLDVRAGVRTGECERQDGKVAGIAVNIGARVAAAASPGEVLVSGTVKDLVAGSGLQFEDRGTHELKRVPGEWRLYAVRS